MLSTRTSSQPAILETGELLTCPGDPDTMCSLPWPKQKRHRRHFPPGMTIVTQGGRRHRCLLTDQDKNRDVFNDGRLFGPCVTLVLRRFPLVSPFVEAESCPRVM